jgi:nucleoside-diphosphate-sugar epimerase
VSPSRNQNLGKLKKRPHGLPVKKRETPFRTSIQGAMAKLVVPGGNGFIGSEICRVAVQNGHDVAAFGRTGRPPLTPARHPWVGNVEWRAADVFEPDTWRDLLEGADAVVHAIATIREAPAQGVTFDRMNAESALLVAESAVSAGVGSFVFLSVRDKPPFVPLAFLTAKRRAERQISDRHPELRAVNLRPNLVYGPHRRGSATIAAVLEQLPEGSAGGYAAGDGHPLPVELVAAAAVHAALTPTLTGTLAVPQIADLGRTSGLVDLDDVSESSLTPLLAGLAGTGLATWLLRRWWS